MSTNRYVASVVKAVAWAHSVNDQGARHSLRDHLLGTADLARGFGEPLGVGDAAYAVGLLHDAGKVHPDWQQRLRCMESGLRPPEVVPGGGTDHPWLGSAMAHGPVPFAGPYAVRGHHRGIPNCGRVSVPARSEADPVLRSAFLEQVPEAAAVLDGPALIPPAWRDAARADWSAAEFQVRMLYSMLVDADFLDTAAHFGRSGRSAALPVDFAELAARFEQRRVRMLRVRGRSPVDLARATVYEQAVAAANLSQGVFRLAAPTGSGKTLAAAAFALQHAALHGLRRVVVAVPFLTITEQNAAVYRDLLGEQAVLEHHSAVEPDRLARYAVENWDAPFIVTTTVQLFESMFSNRPSRTRKLHRLARSVIVLDEVQALPTRLLPVILDGLRVLVQQFGATVLVSSATQPAWDALAPWRDHVHVREVVPQPRALYRTMSRVTATWRTVPTAAQVVEQAAHHDQLLLILNSTKDSRDLARMLQDRLPDDQVAHLSTRMCQAHRRSVLARVRRRLTAGEATTLVSTQLIEAGVDVDFPVVMRAMAPAPSLLQAAGRVNREGRRQQGHLVVIDCPQLAMLRDYRTGVTLTAKVFGPDRADLDDPDAMRRYFRELYGALGVGEHDDAATIQQLRRQYAFASVADKFHLIEDSSTAVVVPYDEAAQDLVSALGRQPSREQLRSLQPYLVTLPAGVTSNPAHAPHLEEVAAGVWCWRGGYDQLVGVDLDATTDTIW